MEEIDESSFTAVIGNQCKPWVVPFPSILQNSFAETNEELHLEVVPLSIQQWPFPHMFGRFHRFLLSSPKAWHHADSHHPLWAMGNPS